MAGEDPEQQFTKSTTSERGTVDPQVLLHDKNRLEALARIELLDTPPEKSFDRLTRLAAKLIGAPATFISLLDANRDFYKSSFGFPEPLASRRQIEGRTLCHYTLRGTGPLVIHDTHADPTFHSVPTVELYGIRAYAGVPLITGEGYVIGSFCAIDYQPRTWSEQDIEILTAMAESALREMLLRQTAAEAIEQTRLAREATRTREQVLAIVAHDLRAPLNFIKVSAQLISDDLSAPENVDLLDRMQGSVASMSRLIEDLLEASRPDEISVILKPVPAQTLLEEVALTLQPVAHRQGIKLTIEPQPNLPKVLADYERILRVFANLIVNALKFSPHESSVKVKAERSGNAVRFCVIDYGPGIPAENLKQLFDRFWQGDSNDRRGSGLGLGIAQAIIRAHGGELTVASELGHGATFCFELAIA